MGVGGNGGVVPSWMGIPCVRCAPRPLTLREGDGPPAAPLDSGFRRNDEGSGLFEKGGDFGGGRDILGLHALAQR